MITGGWRLVLGAAFLSASLVAPATAHADTAYCSSPVETELPVPQDVLLRGVTGAAGSWAVGNGFTSTAGSVVLVWHNDVLVARHDFADNRTHASAVNASGVVVGWTARAAFRWQDGKFTTLDLWPGTAGAGATDVNARGDVLGISDNTDVVWPAGSSAPVQVPGTEDGTWYASDIDDDGSVVASQYIRGIFVGYRLSATERVRLAGATSSPRGIRGGHVVGIADGKVVRWNRDGALVGTYGEAKEITDVTSSGLVLGKTSAELAVWSGFGRPDWRAGDRKLTAITEEGHLYGTDSDSYGARAIKLACA